MKEVGLMYKGWLLWALFLQLTEWRTYPTYVHINRQRTCSLHHVGAFSGSPQLQWLYEKGWAKVMYKGWLLWALFLMNVIIVV